MINLNEIVEAIDESRKKLRQRALETLINNQETYVAQWILQNPDKRMEDYTLQFQWIEDGYTVTMVEKENV